MANILITLFASKALGDYNKGIPQEHLFWRQNIAMITVIVYMIIICEPIKNKGC